MKSFTKGNAKCSGCGRDEGRMGPFGFNCAECESFLSAREHLEVNFLVTLERWRHRHGLTREAALQIATDALELREDLVNAAMQGHTATEIDEPSTQGLEPTEEQ